MLPKLLELFHENDCKLLIKYDGERTCNKYTVRIIYYNPNKSSLGKDTDEPLSLLTNILNTEKNFSEDEIFNLFFSINDKLINPIKRRFGDKSVIILTMEENDKRIVYELSLRLNKTYIKIKSKSLEEMIEEMKHNCII